MSNYKTDKLYKALVAAIKVAASEHGPNSREYWTVQSVITDLRPECAIADPKSPLKATEDETTNGYADRPSTAS